MKIEELSIEEKVGQMIMIGLDTPHAIDIVDDLILKYKIGGILLYKKNYANYEELIKLVNHIKKTNKVNKVPIFIAIDQEGGRVNRMPKDFENLPSASTLANSSENTGVNFVKEAGEITGEMLSKIGINMDFAPVLDLKRFEDKHAIGDRAYSYNVDWVTKYGIDYMMSLQDNNIVSVIKHFPGHGATVKDSHFTLPIVRKKIKYIEKEDMVPFEKAIKEGADALLVGHLLIKNETNKLPATMSKKFITKYIRKKYHYKGLIITDDMRMKGVRLFYGKNKAVKKAFFAGNDIILIKYGKDKKLIEQIINEIKKDKLKEIRINRSIKRILNVKEKYNVNDKEITINKSFIRNVNNKIINIKRNVSYKSNNEIQKLGR